MGFARSRLNPRLRGRIIKWLDPEQFILSINGKEIIGNKRFWELDYVQ